MCVNFVHATTSLTTTPRRHFSSATSEGTLQVYWVTYSLSGCWLPQLCVYDRQDVRRTWWIQNVCFLQRRRRLSYKPVHNMSHTHTEVTTPRQKNCTIITTKAFSALNCWLGGRKGIRPVKTEWWGAASAGMVSVWSEVQTCIRPSWCHCHSLSLASVKPRLVLPFWYRPTRVVPEKRAVKRVCVSLLLLLHFSVDIGQFQPTKKLPHFDCQKMSWPIMSVTGTAVTIWC